MKQDITSLLVVILFLALAVYVLEAHRFASLMALPAAHVEVSKSFGPGF
jgi:hypothetical protein